MQLRSKLTVAAVHISYFVVVVVFIIAVEVRRTTRCYS